MKQSGYGSSIARINAAVLATGSLLACGMRAGLLCSVLFTLSLVHLVRAAPGDLDRSFGTGGLVTTDFSGASGFDIAYAIAIQQDGKIVVAGDTLARIGTHDFAVARYHANGKTGSQLWRRRQGEHRFPCRALTGPLPLPFSKTARLWW